MARQESVLHVIALAKVACTQWQLSVHNISACAVGGTTSSFAVRSKAAVLLALVTKRQGGELLQALLPELLRLAAEGPTQAELVRSFLQLNLLPCHCFTLVIEESFILGRQKAVLSAVCPALRPSFCH